MFGRELPRADFRRFVLCNRFAASDEGRMTRALLVYPGGEVHRGYPAAFYSIKDRIMGAYGKLLGYSLQTWTSYASDYGDYDGGIRDGASHQHVLERVRLGGRTYHRPTNHFCYDNNVSGYFKKSVGFEALKAQCTETLKGKKKVTHRVPDKAGALDALRRLARRYGRLSLIEKPRPRIVSGDWYADMLNAQAAREHAEALARRAASPVQCHWCLRIFSGGEMSRIDGHEFCAECVPKLRADTRSTKAGEGIPF